MSVEVWSIALNAKIGNPAKKAVLLGLANHASPDGKHCYPSVRRLAVYSELSESTVRTKMAELREDKIIKVVRKSYRYRPTEYEINIKKLKAMRSSDLHLLEVSSETPTVRGISPRGLEAQTSEKPIPDLQETDIRPPGDGGKPSLTVKEPSLKRLKDSRSLSQDNWVKVLMAISLDYYNGRNSQFERNWSGTGYVGREDGKFVVVCRDEEQQLWLKDHGKKIAENMLVGVLGARVEVEFVVKEKP